MSKIVCDICGTTYPETATQCPICGSARPVDIQPLEMPSGSAGYTYVKGGRFSKSNVRKRNSGKEPVKTTPKQPKPAKKAEIPASQRKEKENSGDSNRGLIITAIVLLVAVIAVVGYIAVRYFFVPDNDGAANVKDMIPCVSISVDKEELVLDLNSDNKTADLKVITTPTNTTEKVTYTSLDPSIATVDGNGKITAMGVGTVQIKIVCGDKEKIIEITIKDSSVEEVDLRLLCSTYTMTMEDETYILYVEEISGIKPSDINWSSDKPDVVTVADGVITAVSEGEATITAEYKGVKVTCEITVDFGGGESGGNGVGEDDGGNGGGVGEDDGNTMPTDRIYIYTLWNTELVDFTVANGNSETLVIKDSNGNEIDAVLTVDDESVCSISGNVVTGLGGGVGTITATYNGLTATCIVRSY